MSKERKEAVNHPDHYKGAKFECIDVMEECFGIEETKSFCKLNAFKYIWRCNNKVNTTEDIQKANWYINKYLELDQKQAKIEWNKEHHNKEDDSVEVPFDINNTTKKPNKNCRVYSDEAIKEAMNKFYDNVVDEVSKQYQVPKSYIDPRFDHEDEKKEESKAHVMTNDNLVKAIDNFKASGKSSNELKDFLFKAADDKSKDIDVNKVDLKNVDFRDDLADYHYKINDDILKVYKSKLAKDAVDKLYDQINKSKDVNNEDSNITIPKMKEDEYLRSRSVRFTDEFGIKLVHLTGPYDAYLYYVTIPSSDNKDIYFFPLSEYSCGSDYYKARDIEKAKDYKFTASFYYMFKKYNIDDLSSGINFDESAQLKSLSCSTVNGKGNSIYYNYSFRFSENIERENDSYFVAPIFKIKNDKSPDSSYFERDLNSNSTILTQDSNPWDWKYIGDDKYIIRDKVYQINDDADGCLKYVCDVKDLNKEDK